MVEYAYSYKNKSLKVTSKGEIKEYKGQKAVELFKRIME